MKEQKHEHAAQKKILWFWVLQLQAWLSSTFAVLTFQ